MLLLRLVTSMSPPVVKITPSLSSSPFVKLVSSPADCLRIYMRPSAFAGMHSVAKDRGVLSLSSQPPIPKSRRDSAHMRARPVRAIRSPIKGCWIRTTDNHVGKRATGNRVIVRIRAADARTPPFSVRISCLFNNLRLHRFGTDHALLGESEGRNGSYTTSESIPVQGCQQACGRKFNENFVLQASWRPSTTSTQTYLSLPNRCCFAVRRAPSPRAGYSLVNSGRPSWQGTEGV